MLACRGGEELPPEALFQNVSGFPQKTPPLREIVIRGALSPALQKLRAGAASRHNRRGANLFEKLARGKRAWAPPRLRALSQKRARRNSRGTGGASVF